MVAETTTAADMDDAADTAMVAALVARAGLKLPASEVAGLVTAYRSDRAGLARLREMIQPEDETVHVYRASRRAEGDS